MGKILLYKFRQNMVNLTRLLNDYFEVISIDSMCFKITRANLEILKVVLQKFKITKRITISYIITSKVIK